MWVCFEWDAGRRPGRDVGLPGAAGASAANEQNGIERVVNLSMIEPNIVAKIQCLTFIGRPLPSALVPRRSIAFSCSASASPLCSRVLNASPPGATSKPRSVSFENTEMGSNGIKEKGGWRLPGTQVEMCCGVCFMIVSQVPGRRERRRGDAVNYNNAYSAAAALYRCLGSRPPHQTPHSSRQAAARGTAS